MESESANPPLVCIVGETASGKTKLAIDLALRFNGEIICADSRTIYTKADIGTAKPSQKDQDLVPHYLINVIDPDKTFTAAQFKARALEKMKEIYARGKIPFLVGGTGLYIDAVVYDYQFSGSADSALRLQLEKLPIPELQQKIIASGITLPSNSKNPRHLIRALETGGTYNSDRNDIRRNTMMLGISINREVLKERIYERSKSMLKDGLLDEALDIANQYGWGAPALQSTTYKAARKYWENGISLEDTLNLLTKNDTHLAKRQRTWFKRNKSIHWIRDEMEAVGLLTTFLNK